MQNNTMAKIMANDFLEYKFMWNTMYLSSNDEHDNDDMVLKI